MYGDISDCFSSGLTTLIWRITPMISIVFGFRGILSLVSWIIFLRLSRHFEVHTWYFGIWVLSHSKFEGGHLTGGHSKFSPINCLHFLTHSKFRTTAIFFLKLQFATNVKSIRTVRWKCLEESKLKPCFYPRPKEIELIVGKQVCANWGPCCHADRWPSDARWSK